MAENWLSKGELEVNGKVYHITNPEWIKNLIRQLENDNDPTKDKEASQAP